MDFLKKLTSIESPPQGPSWSCRVRRLWSTLGRMVRARASLKAPVGGLAVRHGHHTVHQVRPETPGQGVRLAFTRGHIKTHKDSVHMIPPPPIPTAVPGVIREQGNLGRARHLVQGAWGNISSSSIHSDHVFVTKPVFHACCWTMIYPPW